jgi:hypothetical protein
MPADLRLAIVVNPELPLGLIANTVGAIAIGLGAKRPDLGNATLADREGHAIDISSNRPVPILAADAATLNAVLGKALSRDDGCALVAFPAFARALHDYRDYETTFPDRNLDEEVIDGIGLAGPTRWVRSLTGSLRLLR